MGVYNVDMIGDPQFINVTPYNPLISRCEIKVFYLGANRNGSYIDKDAAMKLANSLPGVPIVGAYKEDIEDFAGHGDLITIEDGEIKFGCSTVPYGFIPFDAKVWFQEWKEDDVIRTYLMTEGYLWTGQYEEANLALEGKGQSMELDGESLQGYWANVDSSDLEFFIINDGLFSKLCILGDAVEPCFQSARIQSKFSNGEFVDTLQYMVKQLQYALENSGKEGCMDEKVETDFIQTSKVEEVTPVEEVAEEVTTEFTEEGVPEVEEETAEEVTDEFSAEETEEIDEVADVPSTEENGAEEFSVTESIPAAEECDPSSTISEPSFSAELEEMRAELKELREFKLKIDREKKMEIVNRYHMLSDADKQPVIDKLDEYSNLEIEKELAYIYVQNNVDFNTIDGQPESHVEETHEEELTTFSLNDMNRGDSPSDELLDALRSTVNSI